jgi:hypothetical protein
LSKNSTKKNKIADNRCTIIKGYKKKFDLMKRLLVFSLLALILISPVHTQFLFSDGAELKQSSSPPLNWTVLGTLSFSDVYVGDNSDCIIYQNEKIRIQDCNQGSSSVKWKSPDQWQVTEAIVADLNRDHHNELVIVVWRPFKPWPIDKFLPHGGRINDFQDQKGMSCHLILVGWDGEKYRELWAGSSLIDPVFNIHAADLNKDGNQELIAQEGRYNSTNVYGAITAWEWSGFGFRLQSRVDGLYSSYALVSSNQQTLILSEK